MFRYILLNYITTVSVLETLNCLYMLDHSASGRQLVTMVEQLASNHDNTSLMAQIVEQVGLTSPAESAINSVVMVNYYYYYYSG